MKGIPLYKSFNELHKLTGSSLRATHDLFHCFDMSQTNDLKVNTLPPHRAEFYTLALNIGTQQLTYTLGDALFENLNYFILCVAPGQVARWEKKGDWFGYCTFFKSGFFEYSSETNFLRQFPFFNIRESNLIPVSANQFNSLLPLYRQILAEQEAGNPFRDEVIRSLFQAVLWQVRRIYEGTRERTTTERANEIIASQFQYLVSEHFLQKTSVKEYADLLNVTPNHLSETIKYATGLQAKQIISQRRIEEAKYLLKYTDNDIAEIAYHLRFSAPTHFTKFFKKEASCTPLEYRAYKRKPVA